MAKIDGSAQMFDEESIRTAKGLLPRLLRIIFFSNTITNDEYMHRYYNFYKKAYPGKSKKDATQKAASDRKFIQDDLKITWPLMTNVLMAMGLDIASVSVNVVDNISGEVTTFSTTDTIEELNAKLAEKSQIGVSSLV